MQSGSRPVGHGMSGRRPLRSRCDRLGHPLSAARPRLSGSLGRLSAVPGGLRSSLGGATVCRCILSQANHELGHPRYPRIHLQSPINTRILPDDATRSAGWQRPPTENSPFRAWRVRSFGSPHRCGEPLSLPPVQADLFRQRGQRLGAAGWAPAAGRNDVERPTEEATGIPHPGRGVLRLTTGGASKVNPFPMFHA